MSFETFYLAHNISAEEMREKIKEEFRPSKENLDTVTRFMRRMYPTSVPTQEQKDQQDRRREVQQRMVEKMTATLIGRVEAEQARPGVIGLPRELEVFLRIPKDQQDEYNRRLTILSGKDEEAKAKECYSLIKKAAEGLTGDSLRSMTDEQVIENLEQITYLNSLIGETDNLLGIHRSNSYAFTPEQRQELLRLREELQAPLWMTFCRAEMIADPYYVQFPPENLYDLETDNVSNIAYIRGLHSLEQYMKKRESYVSSLKVDLGDRLKREGLSGVPMEQITWLLPNGMESSKRERPPADKMNNGPVVAVLPDKSVKAFAFEMKDGATRWVSGGPELITEYVNNSMQTLPELSKQLKQVDHWYVRSSQEFKDVRTAMEKVEKELQTLGKNPTDYQRKRLAEQMKQLMDVSQTYLNYKNQEDENELSGTAWERMDAVAAIRNFAQNKVEQLGLLDKMTELIRYDQREAEALGDLKNGKSSWLGDAHQARMSADPQQDAKAREELEKAKKNLEKYIPKHELNLDTPDQNKAQYLQKLVAYNNNTIPRSNAAFDVGKMHRDTVGPIARMMSLTSSNAPLTGANAQDARTALAQMILVEMVMKERRETKPDLDTGLIKAGSLESFLGHDIAGKSGETMMLQNIQNSQAFLELTEKLSGQSFRDFFMEDKVQDFSDKVMEELFPHKEQIKAAQEGKFKAPEKALEKSPEEMLKAYKESKIPRSNAAFDVEGLHQDTVGRIAIALKLSSDAPLTGASAQDARTTMAQMILLDLVQKERGDAKPDLKTGQIQAGPLESSLGRDIAGKSGLTMMLQNIQNSESFLEMTKDLNGMSVKNFFTANKAQNVSEKVMEELFPHKEQIKAAQEGKFKAPEKAPEKVPEKSPEEMLQAYKKIRLPRSSERVEGLYQNTVERITPLLNQISDAPLNAASAQDVRTAMAQMILVDMVLKERVSNMFDASNSKMTVGPLESFLDRDIAGKPGMTMMLQNIQNSEAFTEMTKDMTGRSFQNFFLENKARNVSGKIMSELFPHKEQIKAAQQPQVNKTAAQNAPKEQKKDAAPKMKQP